MVDSRQPVGIVLGYDGVSPRIAPTAFVAATATVIGDVEIGEQASVWYGCILRGDVHSIRIGPRSNLQDGTIVHVSPEKWPTVIGADVLVGHGAMLHGCTLEDDCFVGMRATILNGCVVESGGLVAAGALVVEGSRVAGGEVWGGAPARRLRAVRDAELDDMRAAVKHYVALAARHAAIVVQGVGRAP